MFTQLRYFTRWSALAMCSLIIAVLLVACGGSSSSGTTSTPVPTPTTPSAIRKIGKLPKKPIISSLLPDSTGGINLTITVAPDPNGAISADTVASTALTAAQVLLKNAQKVSVPSTTTVGGYSWSQISASGTQRLNNQDTNVQVVALAVVHPVNTPLSKSFMIFDHAPVSTFSQKMIRTTSSRCCNRSSSRNGAVNS